MSAKDELIAHLATGATTTCRAWQVTRKDGKIFGFTDHDRELAFEGTQFKADSGLTASSLQQSTGMAVDNTEVVGALSNNAISEIDIKAGRFDGARVVIWLVNWQNVEEKIVRFRGTFGEIQWSDGQFRVELRGLTEGLNQTRGRVYQATCPAILGDSECRIVLDQPAYSLETTIKRIGKRGEYFLPSQLAFSDRWFELGRVQLLSGIAEGLVAAIRIDQEDQGYRRIELMADFEIAPEVGDSILLRAGCDKLAATCRTKFGNFLNFRGFPHVPGTDWMASYPVATQVNNGSSRFK